MQRAGTLAAQRLSYLSPHQPRHRLCTLGEGQARKATFLSLSSPTFTGEETEALRQHWAGWGGGLHRWWLGTGVSQEEAQRGLEVGKALLGNEGNPLPLPGLVFPSAQ